MTKPDYIEFQSRTEPLAYLITFRSYGTWLHGDPRGSMDRRLFHVYGTPDMPENKHLLQEEQFELKHPPVTLSPKQRDVVEKAIREVCDYRSYHLFAVNVRTNHAHSVVSASCKPEHVMNSFKSHATRQLRRAGLLDAKIRPWSRHGSTPYLWTEEQVQKAIDYVLNGQGSEPFRTGE
jgi:REP element-mobilizing transposase RayT